MRHDLTLRALVELDEDELEDELLDDDDDEDDVPELEELLNAEDEDEEELELDEEEEEELLDDDEELDELFDDEDEENEEELELDDELEGEELELELDELDNEEEDEELEELLDDSYVKPLTSTAELLSGLTSSTSTVPAACGGVSQVTSESLTNVTFEAAAPPKLTEGVASKPEPVTVTGVPPDTSPEPGETELIVGMESPLRMLLLFCGVSCRTPRSRSFCREIPTKVESSDPHEEINFLSTVYFAHHL